MREAPNTRIHAYARQARHLVASVRADQSHTAFRLPAGSRGSRTLAKAHHGAILLAQPDARGNARTHPFGKRRSAQVVWRGLPTGAQIDPRAGVATARARGADDGASGPH